MESKLPDPMAFLIVGVPIVVLVSMIIGFLKKLVVPKGGDERVWLGLAVGLALGLQVLATVITETTPTTLAGWCGLVVLGLFTGLSTSKVYEDGSKALTRWRAARRYGPPGTC